MSIKLIFTLDMIVLWQEFSVESVEMEKASVAYSVVVCHAIMLKVY